VKVKKAPLDAFFSFLILFAPFFCKRQNKWKKEAKGKCTFPDDPFPIMVFDLFFSQHIPFLVSTFPPALSNLLRDNRQFGAVGKVGEIHTHPMSCEVTFCDKGLSRYTCRDHLESQTLQQVLCKRAHSNMHSMIQLVINKHYSCELTNSALSIWLL
jgi:hypothetical protein